MNRLKRDLLAVEIEQHWVTQAMLARARFRARWLGFAAGLVVGAVAAAVVR